MSVDLEYFLESVVASSAEILQIHDRGSDESYEIDSSNRLVGFLAGLAYGQMKSHLNRELARTSFIDIYPRMINGEVLSVRQYPVKSITSVILGGTTLVEGEDYILEGRRYIKIGGSGTNFDAAFVVGDTPLYAAKDLRVEYEGGWEEALENRELHAGLVAQTIALYHRKDTLGVGSIKGSSFDGSSAAGSISLSPLDPDAGGIVVAARLSVDRLRFYGACITMELD